MCEENIILMEVLVGPLKTYLDLKKMKIQGP